MISNTDLEKAWFLYKTEALPKGMSINDFCLNKGIPYHEFEKWYKKTHRTVAPVEIVGMPEPERHEGTIGKSKTGKESKQTKMSGKGDLLVTIKSRRGLCLSQGGLDYEGLKLLVERLEGLC